MTDRYVIAIDGPSGSGKSTAARGVALRLGFRFLDSGAMYRALALKASRAGIRSDDGAALAELLDRTEIELAGERVLLDGEDVSREIRTPEITRLVSIVAAVPEAREGIVRKQRACYPEESFVAEGRDMGSVVFPDAAVKVFLTADPRERARRRAVESDREIETVLGEQMERDARDEGREHSPLIRAPGAVLFDTTGCAIDEVVRRLEDLIRQAVSL
jgi:cytidylate kinase